MHLHFSRERNRKIVAAKKSKVLRQLGVLYCEICDFDFESRYGPRGRGYIECHHLWPLYSLTPGTRTRLDDLVLVCANRHTECCTVCGRGRRSRNLD